MSVNQKPSPLSMLTFTTYHYNLKDILEYADTERDLGVDISSIIT